MPDAAMAPPPRCELLIAGDSLAAGWTAPPPPGWTVHIHGQPGETAAALAPRLAALITRRRPQAVLLLAGTNDARAAALMPWRDATGTAAAALAAMAAAAHAVGARVVVARLAAPGPRPWWRHLLVGRAQGRAMQRIEARLRLPPGAARLDVPALLAGPGGQVDPRFRRDHLHFNAAGYARLGAGLAPLLQTACS
jgi:lysophospholipase L1-like esterase